MIDLRSDTVTRPSPGMRAAMAAAEVGDDVFGEDPSVNRLQEDVAELLGKEAALFVPSGTMANQLAIKSQTSPGDEVLVERQSHIFNYESGAPALLSGVQLHVLDGDAGVVHSEQITAAIRHGYYWETPSRLLCLENTINRTGGTIFPIQEMAEVSATARDAGLSLHLDGARLWNAAAATGIQEARYAELFDTVTVCLSKGLGAPVGSLLAGPADTIKSAHRYRKMFGGGMRQAGVLAAAGSYALEHHRQNLGDDHEKIRHLAEGLARIPRFRVDRDRIQTNILTFHVLEGTSFDVVEMLRSRNVLVLPWGPDMIRATAHRDVSLEGVSRAVDIITELCGRA
ncbi:MAG: aminotransferase class V-fold PLP-dependent enzyme [Rhodothermales bacterium]|nr:aminotransferase class V-fold PLP-dependent enzyme [Rhodothermales bacterium]